MVKQSLKGILICVVVGLSFFTANKYIDSNAVTIDFVNVGQGDCALITSVGGRTMLIDSGKADSKTMENISSVAYLRSRGITKLDIMSLSHYDSDHCGALDKIAELFPVDTLFVPEPEDSKDIIAFSEIAKNLDKDTQVMFPNAGDEMKIGDDLTIKALYFDPNAKDSNDRTLVLKVTAFNNTAIFTGDIDDKIEAKLVKDQKKEIDIDIAKSAHHGSRYANSAKFFKALSPLYTVISVGKNSYGHPTQEALANITASGSQIYRTDQDGTIRFVITASGVKAKKM